MAAPAIVLTNGDFMTAHGKTAHGLVRHSLRFLVLAVVDPVSAGRDAGELLDGVHRAIPVCATIAEALARAPLRPTHCIVGVATHGGRLVPALRALLKEAADRSMTLVNGLHEYASDDPDIAAAAAARGVQIIDVRKPRPKHTLHFWTGAVQTVRAPRIAVLGTDCNIGKRTTATRLVESCRAAGIKAALVYTGQTGWMQGAEHGFVLDAVVNDFVSGELEHAIVTCDRALAPDVIVLEGQSALQNPCGPCGAEFLLSGQARAVVLQHAPARRFYEGYEHLGIRIPPVTTDMELCRLYGARVLAVTLNREGLSDRELQRETERLERELAVPVIDPLSQAERLAATARAYIEAEAGQP